MCVCMVFLKRYTFAFVIFQHRRWLEWLLWTFPTALLVLVIQILLIWSSWPGSGADADLFVATWRSACPRGYSPAQTQVQAHGPQGRKLREREEKTMPSIMANSLTPLVHGITRTKIIPVCYLLCFCFRSFLLFLLPSLHLIQLTHKY